MARAQKCHWSALRGEKLDYALVSSLERDPLLSSGMLIRHQPARTV
jgi:hypothetical protein